MGLYLGDKKVSPAIYTTSDIFKIHPPYLKMDWDNDELYVYNRAVNPPFSASAISNVNGIEKTHSVMDGYQLTAGGLHSYEQASLSTSNQYGYKLYPKKLSIGLLGISEAGKYDIKMKYTNIKPRKYDEDTISLSSESDYSDTLHYERWNYTNNTINLNLDEGSASGTLNFTKYNEGKLIDYNKSINYNYDLDPSGRGIDDIESNSSIFKAIKSNDSLICPGYYYGSSYAKVSFTLSADTEVKVKYQITKSSSTAPTILICPIDKNYTSFYYYDKLSSPVVSFNTTTDFEEKEYSFGTLSAGEHFYFVQFYCYNDRTNWSATITPVFEKTPIGKYLPVDITVVNDNNPNPEYEYDPYTGKFKIPMTGNITMTATGANSPLLDKLSITPATWNVNTSTLTWNYSIDGATYHIKTPDGQEYTTTNKSFDFTGKLGESTTDYKVVKMWATTTNNQSGITTLKLMYNPGYNTMHNTLVDNEYSSKTLSGEYPIFEDEDYIYTNSQYGVYRLEKQTGSYSKIANSNAKFVNYYKYQDKHFLFDVNRDYGLWFYNSDWSVKSDRKDSFLYRGNIFGDYVISHYPTKPQIIVYSFENDITVTKSLPSGYSYRNRAVISVVHNNSLYIIGNDSNYQAVILEIKYEDALSTLGNTDALVASNVYESGIYSRFDGDLYFGAPTAFDGNLLIFNGGTFNIDTKEFTTEKYSTESHNYGGLPIYFNNNYIMTVSSSSTNGNDLWYLNKDEKKIYVVSAADNNFISGAAPYNGRVIASNKNGKTLSYFIP